MTPIAKHLKELLPEGWLHSSFFANPLFTNGDFVVRHMADNELELRCKGFLLSSIPVRPTESVYSVHHALKQLFSSLPRYDVRLPPGQE